ncbi:MAG: cytochrome c oxidase subunit II [Legionellales bacterium]|nr:cytochrome c oxidase subunit II [Legionellales bacterium]OUX66480.1 MAG: cytochrome c oxidase subunit II [Gammaproteobacteria bacterium TMED281]
MSFGKWLLLSLIGASQASHTNLTQGVTPMSHQIYGLHMIIFYICLAIGVGVFIAMMYTLIYHRKSVGAKAEQFHDNLWVEVLWTVIPLLILVVMAVPTTIVLMRLNDARDADVNIKVIGMQWKWRYEYLDHNIKFDSNLVPSIGRAMNGELTDEERNDPDFLLKVDEPVVVPIHKKIRFLVTSTDVIHAWFVPELGINRDGNPGFVSETWAYIEKPGIYRGQCSQLCGSGHAFMPIVVIAVTQKEYEDWLLKKQGLKPGLAQIHMKKKVATDSSVNTTASKPLTKDELIQKGAEVYEKNCVACHQQSGQGQGIFPSLIGSTLATGPVQEHIHQLLFGKNAMPAFKGILSNEEIAAVITYVRNSWGNEDKEKHGQHAGGVYTPEDVEKVHKASSKNEREEK